MAQEASKGRIVGFIALGALLLLVGVAFYSGKAGAPSNPASEARSAATEPAVPAPAAGSTEPLPPDAHKGATITAVLEDVALSPQARLLAERFQCVCGCKDILATCTCEKTPGSRDMKKYLQDMVTQGKTPAEIEAAMIARYGQDVIP